MQKFRVIAAQYGPLEQGGDYASVWCEPLEGDYEERGAPHVTFGPVPMKIDAHKDTVSKIHAQSKLPAFFEIDLITRVSGGNKGKPFVKDVELVNEIIDKATGEITKPAKTEMFANTKSA